MAKEKKRKASQRTEVLKYLRQYKVITDEKAHERFGINRLGSVIYDLRKQGVLIDTVMVDTTNRYGNPTRYGKYYYKGMEV